MNELIGFVFIKKPASVTSRDCINQLQRLLPPKTKIGHAGTLDRFATGLLIVGIGRPATRLFRHLMKLDKKYWVRAKLGEQTDTLDHTGNIINTTECRPSLQQLEEAIGSFQGGYEQTPPLFSALKWQGERLSDMARSQEWHKEKLQAIMAAKKRFIHIYSLKLLSYIDSFMTLEAHVSHGSYIRVLANDIAQKCNSFATTYELERTTIGPFDLNEAVPLQSVTSIEHIQEHIRPVEQIIVQYQTYKEPSEKLYL